MMDLLSRYKMNNPSTFFPLKDYLQRFNNEYVLLAYNMLYQTHTEIIKMNSFKSFHRFDE